MILLPFELLVGIPQGSVLDVVTSSLLLLMTNDGLNNIVSKFADDTRTGSSLLSDWDWQGLPEDLHAISAWSYRSEMPFNIDRAKFVGTKII